MKRDDAFNMIAAVVLSALVVIAWSYFYGSRTPPPAPRPAQAEPSGSGAPPTAAPPTAGTDSTPAEAPAGAPDAAPTEPVVAGDVGHIEVLETPELRILVAARGGRVIEWKLKKYLREPGKPDSGPVDLVSTAAARLDRHPLVLQTGDAALDATLNNAPCTIEVGPPGEGHDGRVAFTWSDGRIALRKTLTVLASELYLARIEWSVTRGGAAVPASILWGPSIGRDGGEDATGTAKRGHAFVPAGGDLKEYAPEDQKSDVVFGAGTVPPWLALTDQYFAVAMVTRDASAAAVKVVPDLGLQLVVTASDARFYAGPKATSVLSAVDRELGTRIEAVIPWGWFGFLARPLYHALDWTQDRVGNWGLAIILVTIVIRLLFVPLTHRSMVKMKVVQQQMARIQPKIHKLREKFKDKRDMESRRKMNEEMMELYRREGINPMAQLSGCLPLLLQLPVLFAMYTVLSVATELRGAPFMLWIDDLSAKDPYYVLPILMGATQLIQQLMTMTKTEDPQARAQQRIMLLMPVFFTYLFVGFPSGLVLYWLVQNLVSIAQQVFINRHAAAPQPAQA